MFTGIVTDVGTVTEVEQRDDRRFTIETAYDTSTIALGASISCSGCCLTAVETGPDWFAVDVSNETLSKTNLGAWQAGTKINLERALKAGAELGGHIVSGHVDGLARVTSIKDDGGSVRIGFEAPDALAPMIAPKGSVALDGVSLTVNDVEGAAFGVNIIPHTQEVTTLGLIREGALVNLEVDMLARYVARLLSKDDA